MKYINDIYDQYTDEDGRSVRVPHGAKAPTTFVDNEGNESPFVPAYDPNTSRDFHGEIIKVIRKKVSRARAAGTKMDGPVTYQVSLKSGNTRLVGTMYEKNVRNIMEMYGLDISKGKALAKLNGELKSDRKDGILMPFLGNTNYFTTVTRQGEEVVSQAHWLSAITISDEVEASTEVSTKSLSKLATLVPDGFGQDDGQEEIIVKKKKSKN